jgi:hypothetical protein
VRLATEEIRRQKRYIVGRVGLVADEAQSVLASEDESLRVLAVE